MIWIYGELIRKMTLKKISINPKGGRKRGEKMEE